tara:strand:+ start:10182 stop:11198 length:1017 start_codon:yes stop_codon:yes gene_type:complete
MTNLTHNLLSWYRKNRRELPWRTKKESICPYYVWISEIMLQQTNAKSVIDYYKKFIKKWPTVYSLSKAKLKTILFFWQGLGYYNRANNLLRSSKIICNEFNGKIPNTYESLIKLPGIGEYTANAILAIAYNKKTIGIDVNINRIVSRIYNLNTTNNREINKKIFNLIPNNNSSDFMQALMDIGATICKKKNVNCNICPLKKNCLFYIEKKRINFESIKKRKKKFLFVFLLKYKNKVLLKKRKKTKLLNGLMEVPNHLLNNKPSLKKVKKIAPFDFDWNIAPGKLNSRISNFDLEVRFLYAKVNKNFFLNNKTWFDEKDIKKVPISSLMKNILIHSKPF